MDVIRHDDIIPEDIRRGKLPKYHPDLPFNDPLVRCNNCGELALTIKWKKYGYCPKCGNRRCRNVINFTNEDYEKAIDWNVDPEFLALFERVDDDEDI